MKFEILFFLVQYLIFCDKYGFTNSNPAVGRNVRLATEFEFPYIVFITVARYRYFDPSKPYFCTGSLVSIRDVISSDDCVKDRTTADVEIKVGSYELRRTVSYYAEWWVGFETWSLSKNRRINHPGNDLTVIRLSQNVTNVLPGRVSFQPKETLYGHTVLLATWGRTSEGLIPTTLGAVELKVLSKRQCEERYRRLCQEGGSNLIDQVICTAAEPFVLVTDGDEGSPIIYQNKIVGFTKSTSPVLPNDRFNPGKVNIHYAPDFYREFLMDVTNNCR